LQVLVALDGLKKKTDLSEDDIKPIETLISEAFSTIDKAVKVGTLHANKGGHQKSRLSRAKRTLLIQHGLYTPSA
jgi:small subunit ribosomal protein S20